MNSIILKSLKNLKYVFSSQVFILIFGLLNTLVVPSIISVSDFGYWQLYLFYSSYVGVFALGFNDGIYLRYGNYDYENLPHRRLRSAIRIHLLVLFIFMLLMFAYSFLIGGNQKQFILIIVSINILILGINGVLIYILQITNNIKKYSYFSVLPKFLLILGILLLIIFKLTSFRFFVIFDLVTKSVVVVYMMVYLRDLWVGPNTNLKEASKEYLANVSVGIRLMLAQLMGMLVLGIGRFIVELLGSIDDFAYYSFGVTITNLVLVIISSVSLLAYPTLKRLEFSNYPKYFEMINNILQKFNIIIPIIYFIAAIFITVILPKYILVLDYLNILFGVIIFQAKMQLLNNTFYKALRKETAMLKANLSSIIIFIIIAPLLFFITKSVYSIALSTLIIIAWRSMASEIYLRRVLGIENFKGIIYELVYIIIFTLITSVLAMQASFIIYIVFLIIILIINREYFLIVIKKIRLYMKGEN